MERETPITLLIIDSDTQWLEYIAPTLQQAGFEVLTAISGAQALRIIKRTTPELLLLNIFLP
ncbi:MAG: DNA-binding response regulator, partial [Capnocytophaga granulosa]